MIITHHGISKNFSFEKSLIKRVPIAVMITIENFHSIDSKIPNIDSFILITASMFLIVLK